MAGWNSHFQVTSCLDSHAAWLFWEFVWEYPWESVNCQCSNPYSVERCSAVAATEA